VDFVHVPAECFAALCRAAPLSVRFNFGMVFLALSRAHGAVSAATPAQTRDVSQISHDFSQISNAARKVALTYLTAAGRSIATWNRTELSPVH
jgi:hypothetical protein